MLVSDLRPCRQHSINPREKQITVCVSLPKAMGIFLSHTDCKFTERRYLFEPGHRIQYDVIFACRIFPQSRSTSYLQEPYPQADYKSSISH